MKTIIKDTEKVEIDKKLKKEVQALCEEESQVIVHCRIVEEYGHHIRIWKNTNLIAHGSAKKSALTHAEHIAFHPRWTLFNRQHNFTLFFKGLSKTCEVFDLIEDIPEPGGFIKKNIKRNNSDVYHIRL
tara:strand:+ start:191 stop:577 length:387 start_codon:yes stop_codon:yes gene_type:complete